jgi:hypothetical protein
MSIGITDRISVVSARMEEWCGVCPGDFDIPVLVKPNLDPS